MNTPISNRTLDILLSAAADISYQITDFDPFAFDQLELDIDGADQACEAFMVERSDLASRLVAIEAQRDAIANILLEEREIRSDRIIELERDAEAANNVFRQIGQYANALTEALASIGVSHRPNEDGSPNLIIEADILIPAVLNQLNAG